MKRQSVRHNQDSAFQGKAARGALPLFWCAVLASAAINCGGKGGSDKDGSGGSVGTGGTVSLASGGSGSATDSGVINPNQDGGRRELTSAQVDEVLAAECTGWAGEGESVPSTLQLVVDVSGSMDEPPPGGGTATKWEITRDALDAAIGSLPPSISVGVLYYPNQNVTSSAKASPGQVGDCVNINGGLPIAKLDINGSAQRTAFSSSLQAASIQSYTPTNDAYEYALENSLVPYQGQNKFMLLITDGAPTIDQGCTWPVEPAVTGPLRNGSGVADGVTAPIVSAVQSARETYGIKTFVIGAPGSERSVESNTDKRPWLSEAATVGGTAAIGCTVNGPAFCHFDMTQGTDFAGELTAGLAAITGQIIDACSFTIPAEAPGGGTVDPAQTQIIIEWGDGNNDLILPDGNGDCADGWEYDSAAGTVVLCGQTCDQAKLDEKAVVHVSFGCATEEAVQARQSRQWRKSPCLLPVAVQPRPGDPDQAVAEVALLGSRRCSAYHRSR
jgi:hypothetical protein